MKFEIQRSSKKYQKISSEEEEEEMNFKNSKSAKRTRIQWLTKKTFNQL